MLASVTRRGILAIYAVINNDDNTTTGSRRGRTGN